MELVGIGGEIRVRGRRLGGDDLAVVDDVVLVRGDGGRRGAGTGVGSSRDSE